MKFKIKPTNIYVPSRDGVSQSLLENYRDCQVKMRYITDGYHLPSTSEAIMFGSAIHYGLDEIYNAIKNGDVTDHNQLNRYLALRGVDLLKNLRAEYSWCTTDTKQKLEDNISKALIMLPLYFKYWNGDYALEWVGLEREFKFDVAGMFFRGKRDGEFYKKSNNGKSLWLFETKTKARYNIDTIMQWVAMQLQVNAYLYSLYIDYEVKPVGVVYNIIRNPAIKKTARKTWEEYREELTLDIQTRPHFYFQRIERAINFNNVIKYYFKLNKELTDYQKWYATSRELDMPCGSSCEGKYGKCMFLHTCASGGKDFSYFEKRTNLFPEL